MDTIQPVKRSKLTESIVNVLLTNIKNGTLAPGSKLPPERELMKKLQVGRSTLREAVQSLALMGILDVKPGEGTFVRAISKEEIIGPHIFVPIIDNESMADFFEARLLIEPRIAALAALRRNEQDIVAIEQTLSKTKQSINSGGDVDRWAGQFHLQIARASKNIVCVRFLEAILSFLVGKRENAEHSKDFLQWEYESHERIFKAITKGDDTKAYKAMEEHIQAVLQWYKKLDIV
ncbi:MAG: FadR family transcriptional regulator [Spirochaetes bacterium]|nr:FadR family transcriptional regulator [Spirochaetota bacterium]